MRDNDPDPGRQTPEEWRPVPGFDLYEVSDLGRVRSLRFSPPRVLKDWALRGAGHRQVHLRTVAGERVASTVHRLVFQAFVGAITDGLYVLHNNGIAHDNRPSNLRLGTAADNAEDARRHGVLNEGARHGMAILTEQDVRDILASDETGPTLAKRYGTTTGAINSVRAGKSWRCLGLEPKPRRPGPKALLTDEQVHELRTSTETIAAMAVRFGVDHETARKAARGLTHRHIPTPPTPNREAKRAARLATQETAHAR